MSVNELSKENIKDIYPLSPMQEGMFFHWLYDNTSRAYFEQISYRLEADLDAALVKRSLQELFKQYDILRTVFSRKKITRILQVVLKERSVDFYREDLSQRQDKEEYIKRYKEEDKKKGFDLTKDVLMRVALFQLDETEHEFIWSFHHILMDGWCLGLLISRFREIYNGLVTGKSPQFVPVKPYREYIQWLENQDREKSRIYWRNYLEDYNEQVGFPCWGKHASSTDTGSYKLERVIYTLGESETARLLQWQAKSQFTLNTIVRVTWGILLGKYNGKQDVVFGSVVSGRPGEIDGVDMMVGLFINTIPIRVRFHQDTTMIKILQDLQQAALESEPHHYCPLVEIQAESRLKQNLLDHIMEFQSYPVVQQIPGGQQNSPGSRGLALKVTHVEIFEQTHYPFNLRITPGNRLEISLEFNRHVHDPVLVKKVGASFLHLLVQVPDSEDLRVQTLGVLTEKEKRQILDEFNNTTVEYPSHRLLHEMFRLAAAKSPDYTAVVLAEKQITYRELDKASDALAAVLMERGLTAAGVAALMPHRSPEMIIGIMAVLKVGAAYLPIDPTFPQDRIDYMLADSSTRILLTTPGLAKKIKFEKEIVYLADRLPGSSPSTLSSSFTCCPSHPAYVIYTSGSTGKPKGVMVMHKNVVNFNKGITRLIDFCPGDVMLALTTISFDIFVLEILLPLLNHLGIVIADEPRQKDPELLGEVIVKHCVDMLQVTPSTLQMLMNSDANLSVLKQVKELMVGGEAFPDHLFNRVKVKFNGRIHNMYGPTETTVWSAVKELTPEDRVTIGTPIANTQIYIVDPMFQLQPIGAAGELYIGGDGVAKGYINKPDLTSEKFDHDLQDYLDYHDEEKKSPVKKYNQKFLPGGPGGAVFTKSAPPGRRRQKLYRTGDLAGWLPDRNIEFLGRLDHQVKVRGFRIELGEIEAQLLGRRDIKEAVAIIKEDHSGDKHICAYLVPYPGNPVTDTELREYLSEKLPYYMIPSYFMELEQIPLTPNGKIDRKALPEAGIDRSSDYTAPRDELEEKLGEIWSLVLGRDIMPNTIGIDDNFFRLGGHSLKAVTLLSKIHQDFHVKLPLAELFKRPTIRRLAENIRHAVEEKYTPIEVAEQKEYYPLSSPQKRLYLIQQMDLTGTAYNQPQVLSLGQGIDIKKIEKTFIRLTERHESLRTSLHIINNQPVQRIHRRVDFKIEYYSPAGPGARGTEKAPPPPEPPYGNIIRRFVRPFEPGRAPLLRVGVINPPEGNALLMIDMHHIIADRISHEILVRDFFRIESGETLPPLTLQYKDYAQWQNSEGQQEIMKNKQAYWLKQYEGEIPLLNLPIDYKRSDKPAVKGARLQFYIKKELLAGIKSLMSETDTTLYMILLAVYSLLLSIYTRQQDIIIGSPVAGRRDQCLEDIVGMFVNMLPMRNQPHPTKILRDFINEVKTSAIDAFENQDYPFDQLVETLGIPRNLSRKPLVETVFTLQNTFRPKNPESPAPRENEPNIKHHAVEFITTMFDLTLDALEQGEVILIWWTYSTELFNPSTIEKLNKHYMEILEQVVENIDIKIKDIKISHDLVAAESNPLKTDQGDFGF
ncbi:MAG: amino acid adenylation domain-containing protein [Candidatus Aminicenantes bacterium]